MISHQFNAQKTGVFSLISTIFIFTSLAINYSPKLWHQSVCHSFHQTLYSFHMGEKKNIYIYTHIYIYIYIQPKSMDLWWCHY